jgi:lipoate-protein ligase A
MIATSTRIVEESQSMQHLTMAQLATQIGHTNSQRFRGRELGTRFYIALQQQISAIPRDDVIRFDLHSVGMMDVSFIDEVFGGIAEARGRGALDGAALLLVKADPLDVDDIARILAGRPAYVTGLRNCVLPLEEASGIRLIGKTEDYIAATYADLEQQRKLTASEFAKWRDLALNTASTRLKALYDLGIALRQPQQTGRGFVYRLLTE